MSRSTRRQAASRRLAKEGVRLLTRRRRRGPLALLALAAMVVIVAAAANVDPEALPGLGPPGAQAQLVGPATVIDGDTVEVAGQRVRLHGIDAPEARQTCVAQDGREEPAGRHAEQALAALADGRPVRCAVRETDRFGRAVAVCEADGQDLSAAMTRAGWAFAYTRYAADYAPDELQARLAGRGVWAWRCETPWEHRRNRSA